MTDRELIERYVRGEGREEAFRALVERYGGMVQLACERQLRDRQLAEDAMQGVFVLLSEKAGTVREGKLAGWLLGVARFACAKVGRERMRRERREKAATLRGEVVVAEERGETRELLDAGLMTLGSGDREAVAMRYLGERQLSEVGEAMGISEEAARKRVTRGVEKLRKYFARCGMVASVGVVVEVLAAEGAKGAEVHLSVSEKVMSAWRGGASEATRAGQVAKGTKAMMKMARIKMAGGVAVAVMGVMVAGVGGWFTTEALAARGRAAGVPTVMVAASPPAAPGPVATMPVAGDLSTPTKALETLCDAMGAGDRARMYACMTMDPKREPTLLDGSLALGLADTRLGAAAEKAFGPSGRQLRTMTTADQIGSMIKSMFGSFDQAMTVKMDGETARVTMVLSPDVLALVPAGLQGDLKAFEKKPLLMKKVNGGWRLDADRCLTVEVELGGKRGATVEEERTREVTAVMGLVEGLDDVTKRVESGELGTVAATRRAIGAEFQRVMRESGGTTFLVNTTLGGGAGE